MQVLKGTATLYDAAEHAGQAIETITQNAFRCRKKRKHNSEAESAAAASSSSSIPAVSLSSFSLFSQAVIKLEKCGASVEEIMNNMRAFIKSKRDGNNADSNCGFLTEHSILALVNLLQGKEISDRDIPTKSSLDSTESIIHRSLVSIKNEDGERVRKQLRTSYSAACVNGDGLHSILPAKEVPLLTLTENAVSESTMIDIDAKEIPRTKIKTHDLEKQLMSIAQTKNRVLVGHITLARLSKKDVDHALAFCATKDKIFFVDGQFYDGITKQGDPILENLNQHFEFITQNKSSSGDFADDCFYLIHHELPIEIVSRPAIRLG